MKEVAFKRERKKVETISDWEEYSREKTGAKTRQKTILKENKDGRDEK